MDLAGGGWPQISEQYLLNGKPSSAVRETFDRRLVSSASSGVTLTQATLYVFALACQAGDIVGAVSIGVKTNTATPTHSWAALYTGVTTADTLITQSTDNAGGFGSAGAVKITLGKAYQVGGQGGTPQGAAYTGGPAGAVVLGLALYNSGATGAALDGIAGGSVAGAIASGQLALVSTQSLAATATAPATLASIAAAAGPLPYAALTRS